ncbi:MAG TPA: hypothetical protein DCY20_09180 [Firmicutes bacterium]|nr:hypothetical protein [Bacillota bacterium]
MIAFMKKEWVENIKTFKVLILLCVSFIFGMISPLLAKLMPDLMSQMDIEGMTIIIPDPTALDAYVQFFKNMTQMGLIVLVLIFSGMLTAELSKGTLINLLTKGLSRTSVIVSKYTVAVLLWSISLIVAAFTTYGYTIYLFESFDLVHIGYSMGCLWLFGVFLLALMIFWQTVIQTQYGNLLMVALSVGALFMLNVMPKCQPYNPLFLVSNNVAMLNSEYDLQTLLPPVWITGGLTIVCLGAAIIIFRNKRI